MNNPDMTLTELAIASFRQVRRFDDVFEQLPELVAEIAQKRDDIADMEVRTNISSPTQATIGFILKGNDEAASVEVLSLTVKEGTICHVDNSTFAIIPVETPEGMAEAALKVWSNLSFNLQKERKNNRSRPKKFVFGS